ncbi:cytosine-specific methyltransferase [Longispora fulva]|uniref:Cytosine-specific methyltransferase n=1 Tax=Longispora fulva TaxID=619741 RepID=A0A8J7KRY9_9ACTN|nr:DNA cytosine methyltransferase [Longispora fulva]MBG6139032.1 DNA (cytosine-5)-methyltransferase 1 [Longispora fulva]GIG58525.1 cytosine-specific methyltransferase [Longispora fulva]
MTLPELPRLTVLSLFTGTGGLDCGLEAAGLETVGCVELNELCRRSLEENRPGWKLLDCADVLQAATELRPRDLGLGSGALDVIAGGPPCQPFSVAGQWTSSGRRGMDDERAQTVVAMLDLVEAFLPRVLLIENVAGFLRGKISAQPFVEGRLNKINKRHGTSYQLQAEIVDAADYGVPQHRRRVIAVATRDGSAFALPAPTHAMERMTAWDAMGDLCEAVVPSGSGGWSDLLPSIPEGSNYQYLTARGGGSELFGYRTRYWSFLLKLARDKPAWTLPASPGPSTGPFHWDNRPLSVRERLRLQSFPDDWQPVGRFGEQVKQVGNATPPLLGEVIARALVGQVLVPGAQYPAAPALLRPRLDSAPQAVPPVPVPARFSAMVGEKPAHLGVGKGPAPRQTEGNEA